MKKQEAIADALSFYEEINIKYMGTVNIITFIKGFNGLVMHRLGPDGDNNKAKMVIKNKISS